MHASRRRSAALLLSLGFWGWGCGNPGAVSVSGSSEEATVTGTVTINGKPATEGEVFFDPANINRRDASLRKTKIEPDGTYTIKTLVGENTATVDGVQARKANLGPKARKSVDVKAGENAVPLDVPVP